MQIVFGLLGGLAVFIYGMNLMSESLQKAAGEKMKSILALLTKNRIMGVIAGALVTAVLQSSSATTVMAIGFVSAGLMSLPQAISIIFGANIGTTMTAQIIAFKITDYIYAFIFVGFILSFVCKSERIKSIEQTIFAFGLLFLGIETMGDVMKPLASSPVFTDLIGKVSGIPVLGLLLGTAMTLVVQSSSATIAVLQNFAAQPGADGVTSILGLAGGKPVFPGGYPHWDWREQSRFCWEIISERPSLHCWHLLVRAVMPRERRSHIRSSTCPDLWYLSGL